MDSTTGRWRKGRCAAAFAAALCAAGAASAQDHRQGAPPPDHSPSRTDEVRAKTGEIITQPARDVGISRAEIPPVLVQAMHDPYSLAGLKTCKQLASAVKDLNAALGPDFVAGNERKENRVGKLAEAGGKTVVNSIIPFRSLVREISGAAPAQRRLSDAIDAGYARRGYLRGVHHQRGCRTPFF